jgi:acetyl-CoA carboxylase alpha subunit
MDRERGGRVTPGGYRKTWRGLALAERLAIPVVTLIDTPGADASAASEAGGIAHHIARTFREVLTVRVPVVSLVIGEGGSGGALALAVGDRLLMQEHAIFSVIAPEGAAAILHRDRDRAPEVAALLDPTARRLHEFGIADEVVPEPAGGQVAAGWAAVTRHLDALSGADPDRLVATRQDRWRRAGT